MSVRWHKYPTAGQAAEACAHSIVASLQEALSGKPHASLAVSGGTTPKPLFEALVNADLPWKQVHLFWVDERAVPPTDERSNYRLAEQYLIVPARIPRRNVHRIAAELGPELAARRYREELVEFFQLEPGQLPSFDVIQRGLGAEGHTASLFPGDPLIDDRDGIAAAVYVNPLREWRITLLPGVLMAAHHTVFLVTGPEKAQAVRAVFHEPYNPQKYPAQILSHHGRGVTWFLDEAAASLMD